MFGGLKALTVELLLVLHGIIAADAPEPAEHRTLTWLLGAKVFGPKPAQEKSQKASNPEPVDNPQE